MLAQFTKKVERTILQVAAKLFGLATRPLTASLILNSLLFRVVLIQQ